MRFIIQALADDFESIDSLVNYHAPLGMPTFTKVEVMRALVALMDGGRVLSYLYSEATQKYMPSEFAPANSEKFWFGLSSEGKKLLG